eukprot:scaffold3532_cov182-Ochromonas_danica.AAC.5
MFLFYTIPSYSFTLHTIRTQHHHRHHHRCCRGLVVLTATTKTTTWIERYQSECQELQRIDRILSNRNLGSRKDVTSLLRQGRVKVLLGQGNKVVRSGAEKFPVNILLSIDNRTVAPTPWLAVFHKPVGMHRADDHDDTPFPHVSHLNKVFVSIVYSTVGDAFGRLNLESVYENNPFFKSLHPVGRLDADTSGLLLFSSHGQLTNSLLDPNTCVPRVYEAIVAGKVDQTALAQRLASGVATTDGTFPATLLQAQALSSDDDRLYLKGLIDEHLQVVKATTNGQVDEADQDIKYAMEVKEYSYVRLSVTEGKYRMVRRLLHNAGHSVLLLHRESFGSLTFNSRATPVGSCAKLLWPPQSTIPIGTIRACVEEEEKTLLQLLDTLGEVKSAR